MPSRRGKGAFILTRGLAGWEKTLTCGQGGSNRKFRDGRGIVDCRLLIVDSKTGRFCELFCRYLYNLQSTIKESTIYSVAEVADAGEDHGEAETVGSGDDFGVALGTSGLDDGGGSGAGDFLDAVGEGEEGVGGSDRALERELSLHGAEFGGIDAGHLAGADTYSLSVAGVDDGVGFYVFADLPGEEQGSGLFGRGWALGYDFQIDILQGADVGVLEEHAAGNIL